MNPWDDRPMTRTQCRTISIVIIERWLFLWEDEEIRHKPDFGGMPEDKPKPDGLATHCAEPKGYSLTRIVTSTQTTFLQILPEKESS